ncbi:hypothetical protein [Arthrobacter sp.]|uniref:hypothetical protein n=1 Tax=Arthrobacter sp. TaxID=1667 RepID=UPI003A94B7BE
MDEELDTTYSTLEGVPYVRLFADYGESPVWTWEPLDYAEMQLPPDLEARMRAWEAEYYANDINEASNHPMAQRHRAEGILIAGQLAGELGSPLAVHYGAADPEKLSLAGEDGVEGGRLSLADSTIFHVDTFPVRPAVTRDIIWKLQHPFGAPDDTGGAGALDADWSDLDDGDGPPGGIH